MVTVAVIRDEHDIGARIRNRHVSTPDAIREIARNGWKDADGCSGPGDAQVIRQ